MLSERGWENVVTVYIIDDIPCKYYYMDILIHSFVTKKNTLRTHLLTLVRMQQSATVPEYDLLDVLQKCCVPTGLVAGGEVSGRGTQDQTPLAD